MKNNLQQYPGNPDDLLAFYKNNPGSIEYLKGPILEDKVTDFIAEKVTINEKEVTVEQFKRF